MTSVTYWYHPESDSYWIHDPSKDPPLDGDGLSIELNEYKYVQGRIRQIDRDPEHVLPEDVTAVIKLAEIFGEGKDQYVSGLIHYDKAGRFLQGYPVNTTRIEKKEPGGIYVTKSGNRYLVEVIKGSYNG